MNKSQISLLTESELLMVRETEPPALGALDEDAVGDLLVRVRRARNKYSTNYRRRSAKRVAEKGSRGAARGSSNKTAMKAEIFEDALARVSRRLSVLARESATELRRERIDASRGAPPASSAAVRSARPATGGRPTAKAASRNATKPVRAPRGISSPAKTKQVRSSQAAGARRQAKRDSR